MKYSVSQIFSSTATNTPTAKYTYEDGTLAPDKIEYQIRKYLKMMCGKIVKTICLFLSPDWEILLIFFHSQLSLYKYTYDGYSFI
ncbi:MAG: hypothetical protein ACLUDU_09280 [Butyricimonas faecihominis]